MSNTDRETCCDCSCFSASNLVITKAGEKWIEDLNQGDEVLTLSDDNQFIFSTIYCKAHDNPDVTASYLQLQSENRKLPISHRHFLPVNRDGQMVDVMAQHVKVGDQLVVHDSALYGEEVGLEPVIHIEESEERGVFAPFTLQGRIIVSGVVASCYAEVSPSIAHAALAPLRALYHVTPVPMMQRILTPNNDGVPHVLEKTFTVMRPLVSE